MSGKAAGLSETIGAAAVDSQALYIQGTPKPASPRTTLVASGQASRWRRITRVGQVRNKTIGQSDMVIEPANV